MANRTLRDSECLYDYYIDNDGAYPVAVIRDMEQSADTPRSREAYRSVTNNIDRVIAEIEFETKRRLDGGVAVYRDTLGNYDGIDLIGGNRGVFNLMPGRHTTDESMAISAAREIHGIRLAGVKKILRCLPAGRIEEFSLVELHFDGACRSYWVPGYPSEEDIKRSEPYRNLQGAYPNAEFIIIEVTSRLIYHKAAPASDQLMKALESYGMEMANRLDNVSYGQSNRYEIKRKRG